MVHAAESFWKLQANSITLSVSLKTSLSFSSASNVPLLEIVALQRSLSPEMIITVNSLQSVLSLERCATLLLESAGHYYWKKQAIRRQHRHSRSSYRLDKPTAQGDVMSVQF
ncbi:hypothetical protein Tcan_00597, partial [Toxocara canis]